MCIRDRSREIIQCSDINSKEVAKVEEKVPVSDAVMKSLEAVSYTHLDEQIMGILKYLTDWLINHILYVDCQIPKPQ